MTIVAPDTQNRDFPDAPRSPGTRRDALQSPPDLDFDREFDRDDSPSRARRLVPFPFTPAPPPDALLDPARLPFLRALAETPAHPPEQRLDILRIHADWLEERGETTLAAIARAQVEIRRGAPGHPDRILAEPLLRRARRAWAAAFNARARKRGLPLHIDPDLFADDAGHGFALQPLGDPARAALLARPCGDATAAVPFREIQDTLAALTPFPLEVHPFANLRIPPQLPANQHQPSTLADGLRWFPPRGFDNDATRAAALQRAREPLRALPKPPRSVWLQRADGWDNSALALAPDALLAALEQHPEAPAPDLHIQGFTRSEYAANHLAEIAAALVRRAAESNPAQPRANPPRVAVHGVEEPAPEAQARFLNTLVRAAARAPDADAYPRALDLGPFLPSLVLPLIPPPACERLRELRFRPAGLREPFEVLPFDIRAPRLARLAYAARHLGPNTVASLLDPENLPELAELELRAESLAWPARPKTRRNPILRLALRDAFHSAKLAKSLAAWDELDALLVLELHLDPKTQDELLAHDFWKRTAFPSLRELRLVHPTPATLAALRDAPADTSRVALEIRPANNLDPRQTLPLLRQLRPRFAQLHVQP